MTTPDFTLYFTPLACSFAARTVIDELGIDAKLVLIERENREELRKVNPMIQVPAIVLPDGDVITENASVLQYIGDRYGKLTPKEPRDRTRLHTWLSFIGTELHKAVFLPLLDEKAPADAKAYALGKADLRFDVLAAHFEGGRQTLLDSGLSVADAYLCAVLNWTIATPISLKKWSSVARYHAALLERPSFARALREERELWGARNPEKARLIQAQHEQQSGLREASRP